eukprot:COSAG01_NODE_5562_length_4179_cov_8.225514_4_plen_61_part_00
MCNLWAPLSNIATRAASFGDWLGFTWHQPRTSSVASSADAVSAKARILQPLQKVRSQLFV